MVASRDCCFDGVAQWPERMPRFAFAGPIAPLVVDDAAGSFATIKTQAASAAAGAAAGAAVVAPWRSHFGSTLRRRAFTTAVTSAMVDCHGAAASSASSTQAAFVAQLVAACPLWRDLLLFPATEKQHRPSSIEAQLRRAAGMPPVDAVPTDQHLHGDSGSSNGDASSASAIPMDWCDALYVLSAFPRK
jgi:hypothetical protein